MATSFAIASSALNSTNINSFNEMLSVPLLNPAVLTIHKYIALIVLCGFYMITFLPRSSTSMSSIFSWLHHLPSARSLGAEATHADKDPGAAGQEHPLPHVSSWVPVLGHVMALRQRGGRYIHELIQQTPAQLFTINVLCKRILVAGPSVDRALARHVQETSLAQVVSLMGQRSLGLGDAGVRAIAEHDPRPVHRSLFSTADGVAGLTEAAVDYVRAKVQRQPRRQEVKLGRFVFDLVVGAAARALWGEENPWTSDAEFMEQFIIVSDKFETLGQPMAWLTAAKAYRAREFLVSRLKRFHATHQNTRKHSVAHRINAVAMTDAQWESNDDYYRVELLEALGLLATASTLSVWLVREIIARPALLAAVEREVRASGENNVRASCPTLVAAWYETLRLHMTLVPRVASQGFTLDLATGPVRVDKNDVILMPMLAFNLDETTWGADAREFNPGRFLDASGTVVASKTRRVRGFGVAGNLCPGRAFGFEVAMGAVATVLREFDVEKKAYAQPTAMAGTNVGFERLGDEVCSELRRTT
ncbi:hypothetical protein CDD82_3671 [Ophiocordyceps australis]|uniref:Cytochrome P450 n=1 Tax=Ophiocordyceps australis TaxID=1399860 RepID=A0A2C5ZCD9_9HYPO|nr:hypothetical protein CDD82_3671 [Ophiocordyceps australis]